MDLINIEKAIETNLYHIHPKSNAPLHTHEGRDQIYYCIKGSGFGILENQEIELNVGDSFIVPAGTLHTLRSDGDLYVADLLVPQVDD
ncbi:MAG: cupin domain-containing protein [Marinifilaceae bacterium]